MIKKLVFYFYLSDEIVNMEINKIHLACLEYYMDVFDECTFVISVDDTENYDLINRFEKRLLSIQKKGNVSFEIQKNNEFRECMAFKKNVIEKLGENKLVFFGHTKGVTNVLRFDKDIIYEWIFGLYYYNLNFMEEVCGDLIWDDFISYGAFLTQREDMPIKHKWFYSGTFFWINSVSLNNYIKENNIFVPNIDNRSFVERFLGNVFPSWPKKLASSHNALYNKKIIPFYTMHFIDYYYPQEEQFDAFCKKIMEKVGEMKDL